MGHNVASSVPNIRLRLLHLRREHRDGRVGVGEQCDVRNRDVVLVDDMVSTGGSIVDAARIVKEKGARKVFIVATHAVLCGNAVERLNGADVEKILFADTVPLHDKKIQRLEVCSMAQLLARAIDRIHRSESVSKLFESER